MCKGNAKTIAFSEATVAYDIKADLCNQLSEFYKYQSSGTFIDLSPMSFRFSSFKTYIIIM